MVNLTLSPFRYSNFAHPFQDTSLLREARCRGKLASQLPRGVRQITACLKKEFSEEPRGYEYQKDKKDGKLHESGCCGGRIEWVACEYQHLTACDKYFFSFE